MTVATVLAEARRTLGPMSDSPDLDAAVLLAHVLKTSRPALVIHPERQLTAQQLVTYRRLVERRARRWPVAYLVGQAHFFGLTLRVTPAVLVPRPATELVVDAGLATIPTNRPAVAVDLGTGSGAIALALATARPHLQVIATDVSPAALAVARRNIRTHGLSARIRCRRGSLMAAVPSRLTPGLIIANLPYLTTRQGRHASLRREPRLALIGGRAGLTLVTRLIDELATRHFAGLALELDPGQVPTVRRQLRRQWPSARLTTISDGRHPRGLLLQP